MFRNILRSLLHMEPLLLGYSSALRGLVLIHSFFFVPTMDQKTNMFQSQPLQF